MRLFIGLPVPEQLQKRLARAWHDIETYPGKDRPIKPSLWHLTLAFLDEVKEQHVDHLTELIGSSIRQAPGGVFEIKGFETFPHRDPTRVVAQLSPDHEQQWSRYVRTVRDLASIVAPGVDRRPWKPHISIIRKEKGSKLTHWSEDVEPIEWRPREIAIIRSTATPTGSVYKNLKVFKFH